MLGVAKSVDPYRKASSSLVSTCTVSLWPIGPKHREIMVKHLKDADNVTLYK